MRSVLSRGSLLPAYLLVWAAAAACGGDEPLATGGGVAGTANGGATTTGGAGAGAATSGGRAGAGGVGVDPCEGVECPTADTVCVAVGQVASCRCSPGKQCAEVDECDAEPCDPNAACVELADGFSCTCRDGYSGNGFVCSLGEPCKGVVCPGENQLCVDASGTARCECRPGYEPSAGAQGCVDVDECEAPGRCPVGASCTNFEGGFRCDCLPGYEAAGTGCQELDECAAGLDRCAEGAKCTNSVGDYECACTGGTVGDGFFCKAADSCAAAPCGTGDCFNTPAGVRCECPLGTTGPSCEDTSSCSLNTVLVGGSTPRVTDPGLRAALLAAAGALPTATLTVADVAGVQRLFPTGATPISSLDGVECLANLEELYLSGQQVSDTAPLAALGRLRLLDLSCNPLASVSALGKLTALEELQLARGVTCEAVPKLTTIAGLESLSLLRRLVVTGHAVVDAGPLAGLGRLTDLDLSYNELTGTSSLSAMSQLQVLALTGNPLSSTAGLKGLTNLRSLSLGDTGVVSLADVGSLIRLNVLSAPGNSIADLKPLSGLVGLRELQLASNKVTNVAPLAGLESLVDTNLADNAVTTLQPLAEALAFGQRGRLWISGNPLPCQTQQRYFEALEARGLKLIGTCTGSQD